MKTVNTLPPELWALRDAAIDHVLTAAPLPLDFARIQEWLEIDGWDALVDAWVDEEMALELRCLSSGFTDRALRDWTDLKRMEEVTDTMRVQFSRETIARSLEEDDGCTSKSVHCYRLERDDGHSAVLCCTCEIWGQSGPHAQWYGVFPAREAFLDYLRSTGFVLHREINELSAHEILAFWHGKIEMDLPNTTDRVATTRGLPPGVLKS